MSERKCQDCNEHAGTIDFQDDDLFSITHCSPIKICLCCYIKRIDEAFKDEKKRIKDIKKNLKKQKAKFEKDGCK